jgi:hypothetical protein
MPRAESKIRARIYNLLKTYLTHDEIKSYLVRFDGNIDNHNHYLHNIATLSYRLYNSGFEVQDDEGYNSNLQYNFLMDLRFFINQLPLNDNVDPVEIVALAVEDISIPAEQPDDVPPLEQPDELTLEEIDEEMQMFREERKHELKELAENQNLKQNTYILINSQFNDEIKEHPPQEIEERIYENTPKNYPKILMINKPVNWKASGKNIKDNQYASSIVSYVDQNLVNVYHYNRIHSLDQMEYIEIHKGDPYYDVFHAQHVGDDMDFEHNL